MFCGGPVFNRMVPVKKSIIDSEANIALYSFFLEHLESYLKNDLVVPHYEVTNTLKGTERDIPTEVLVLDFPYKYSHENPFLLSVNIAESVEKSYNQLFEIAARFFLKND